MLTERECIDRVQREWDLLHNPTSEFQQTPEEFGALVYHLLGQPTPPKTYLEIGAGCGHTARIFDSFLDFDIVRLIDNGTHYIGRLKQVPKALEWLGDSMSPEAIQATDEWGQKYDFIFVDGGHSYECVKSDTNLALRCVQNPCLIAYHDARHGEVRAWLRELTSGAINGLSHVRVFGRQEPRGWIVNTSLFRWDAPQ
jgi:hypothetical protein